MWDGLFEGRIQLQKVLSLVNRLPQGDTMEMEVVLNPQHHSLVHTANILQPNKFATFMWYLKMAFLPASIHCNQKKIVNTTAKKKNSIKQELIIRGNNVLTIYMYRLGFKKNLFYTCSPFPFDAMM